MRKILATTSRLLIAIATCLAIFVGCSGDGPAEIQTTPSQNELRGQALELLDFAADTPDEVKLSRMQRAARLIEQMMESGGTDANVLNKTCGDPPISCSDVFDEDYPYWACPPLQGNLPRPLLLVSEYQQMLAYGTIEYDDIDCVVHASVNIHYTAPDPADYRRTRWLFSGGCALAPCYDPLQLLQMLLTAMADFENSILTTNRELSWQTDPYGDPSFVGHEVSFSDADGCVYGFERRSCYVNVVEPGNPCGFCE